MTDEFTFTDKTQYCRKPTACEKEYMHATILSIIENVLQSLKCFTTHHAPGHPAS